MFKETFFLLLLEGFKLQRDTKKKEGNLHSFTISSLDRGVRKEAFNSKFCF